MYALAYNLVRVTMGAAARRQGAAPDRVSFIDALRWLRGRRGGGDAEVGGQSVATWAVRAAGEEASSQAIPGDEEAAGRIAQAVEG